MLKQILAILVVACLFVATMLPAYATIINFEGLADSTSVTTQFPGLTFSNTVVFTAGITLNEFELPPYSASNVAFDEGGPITILFDTPQSVVSGFFTYATLLTLTAFDTASNTLDMVMSAFNSNLGLSGDLGSSPNEFLSVSFPNSIASVTIVGDLAGGSFTLDDLTVTSVPEPSTLLLLATGLIGLIWGRIKRSYRLNINFLNKWLFFDSMK